MHSTPDTVVNAFLKYYTALFGNQSNFDPDLDQLTSINLPRLNNEEALRLVEKVTNEEIKTTLFAMKRSSCGGPDGFNVVFFISTWDILGADFCKAVHNFFDKCKLLKTVNATNLVLIPKSMPAISVTSFRPISYCNVVYKCISKIIAT